MRWTTAAMYKQLSRFRSLTSRQRRRQAATLIPRAESRLRSSSAASRGDRRRTGLLSFPKVFFSAARFKLTFHASRGAWNLRNAGCSRRQALGWLTRSRK